MTGRSLNRSRMASLLGLVMIISATILVVAQPPDFRQRGGRGGGRINRGGYDWSYVDRGDVPMWNVETEFKKDIFTFVRIKYDSNPYAYGHGHWDVDFREGTAPSEVNFSFRLQQLTSMQVNPTSIVLELTDPKLFDYPFIYIVEPGRLEFQEPEVIALRRFCLNGGFLLVDDFWGDEEYDNFYRQIKRVFPNREPTEVPLEHEIFHSVYDLKEKPQLPSIGVWRRGRTWEPRQGSDTSHAYYKSITDDNGRIMVFICHNTDLGDGWEREGFDEEYFEEMSVKKAYPMGINIVTYAMTH